MNPLEGRFLVLGLWIFKGGDFVMFSQIRIFVVRLVTHRLKMVGSLDDISGTQKNSFCWMNLYTKNLRIFFMCFQLQP